MRVKYLLTLSMLICGHAFSTALKMQLAFVDPSGAVRLASVVLDSQGSTAVACSCAPGGACACAAVTVCAAVFF